MSLLYPIEIMSPSSEPVKPATLPPCHKKAKSILVACTLGLMQTTAASRRVVSGYLAASFRSPKDRPRNQRPSVAAAEPIAFTSGYRLNTKTKTSFHAGCFYVSINPSGNRTKRSIRNLSKRSLSRDRLEAFGVSAIARNV